MPREDNPLIDPDAAFDSLIDWIRIRDGTPQPGVGFVRSLDDRLTAFGNQERRHAMDGSSRVLDRPTMWSPPGIGRGGRWTTLAATLALLLAAMSGGYLSGIELPGRTEPTTEIAAPLVGSPTAGAATSPEASPAAVEHTVGRCDTPKTYMSSPGGQMFLHDPGLFSADLLPIDSMQLQHWFIGAGLSRTFPSSEMDGVNGLVMDLVTNGVYRATFDGPVVVSTQWGSWLSSWTYTELTDPVNTVDLGPGESVLFEAGTKHEIRSLSASRGVGIERLILYSGDGSRLIPDLGTVPERTPEIITSADSPKGAVDGITVALDGQGTIPPGSAPPGWGHVLITTEFVISLDDPLTALVPPCEPLAPRQVRNVDDMFNSVPPPPGEPATNQYIGYLVWIGEGGRG